MNVSSRSLKIYILQNKVHCTPAETAYYHAKLNVHNQGVGLRRLLGVGVSLKRKTPIPTPAPTAAMGFLLVIHSKHSYETHRFVLGTCDGQADNSFT